MNNPTSNEPLVEAADSVQTCDNLRRTIKALKYKLKYSADLSTARRALEDTKLLASGDANNKLREEVKRLESKTDDYAKKFADREGLIKDLRGESEHFCDLAAARQIAIDSLEVDYEALEEKHDILGRKLGTVARKHEAQLVKYSDLAEENKGLSGAIILIESLTKDQSETMKGESGDPTPDGDIEELKQNIEVIEKWHARCYDLQSKKIALAVLGRHEIRMNIKASARLVYWTIGASILVSAAFSSLLHVTGIQ